MVVCQAQVCLASLADLPASSLPPRLANETMPLSEGWLLTKWFKLGHVPPVLRPYDYLLHLDASALTAMHLRATHSALHPHRAPSLGSC